MTDSSENALKIIDKQMQKAYQKGYWSGLYDVNEKISNIRKTITNRLLQETLNEVQLMIFEMMSNQKNKTP